GKPRRTGGKPMITVDYVRGSDWHALTVSGHAGYADRGRDIVCAGVSALSCALAGCIPNPLKKVMRDGYLSIECPRGAHSDSTFQMALTGYRQISWEYPEWVQVVEH
ncbi:MAG: ribosomal-processing cysteine protease Prp, partial [Oscillospiraceae bacterium]|nr:ribosomal-processing cysteine protease Prp [Oscillospiraceae bacterium]